MTSAAVPADHVVLDADHETLAAEQEKSKLKKHFGRFDMLFFLICTLVGVDTLGAVANNGPEGFTWLIFLAVFFFVPYAFLTAELGSAFTGEGGCYVWTRLAFGRFVAADQHRPLLALEPGVDGRPALHHRRHDVQHVLRRPRERRQVPVRAGVHLVRRVGGDPVVRRRQVDPDARRLGPHRAARVLLVQRRSCTRSRTACTRRPSASSRRPTRCSSRSSRCCSSTSSASSCRTRPATR